MPGAGVLDGGGIGSEPANLPFMESQRSSLTLPSTRREAHGGEQAGPAHRNEAPKPECHLESTRSILALIHSIPKTRMVAPSAIPKKPVDRRHTADQGALVGALVASHYLLVSAPLEAIALSVRWWPVNENVSVTEQHQVGTVQSE